MSISRKLKNASSGAADGGGGSGGPYVDDVFSTYLYKGNGSSRLIRNGIDLAGEGGMVWTKVRDFDGDHVLVDSERGVDQGSPTGYLKSNSNSQELTASDITGFHDWGFELDYRAGNSNAGGFEFSSWTFRKAPKFFDVVTYTGDGVAGREIPHNLGVEPGMVIVKRTDNTDNWYVQHRSTGPTNTMFLDTTTASTVRPDWDDTAPTNSVFTVGNLTGVNTSGGEYVAYLFAHDDSDESIIKCGSYTGNNSSDGPEIDLGFEPQWVMIKRATNANDWLIYDSMRGIVTGTASEDKVLYANKSEAERQNAYIRLLPDGFKLEDANSPANDNGSTYIYMAIRRPNKPAEEFEPEELFAVASKRTETDPGWISGFPTDFALHNTVNESGSTQAQCRLMGTQKVFTDKTDGEAPISANLWDYMDGNRRGNGTADPNEIQWMWRRAPGYFDVVCYEGDGQAGREVPHNLGVAPEMMWVKARTGGNNSWRIGGSKVGNGTNNALLLNTDQAMQLNNTYWDNKGQTSDVLHFGSSTATNGAGVDFIAYLFASVPGISKVGSYTGTGNALLIDCGFTTGARFLLIKRTDGSGGWFVWDSARGMTGNPPMNYLRLDSTINEQPGRWFVTVSEGFQLRAMDSYKTEINVSGQEYIFYAIAE